MLADRFNDVNEAHPFREGNGRTQRLYFDQVAEAGGKTIHWSVLTKEQNIAVSHAARDGNLAPLRDALERHGHRPDGPSRAAARQAGRRGHARHSLRPARLHRRMGDAGAGERSYYGPARPRLRAALSLARDVTGTSADGHRRLRPRVDA